MLSLSEHQSRWREALLAPDEGLAASLHPALAIHRNNFFHATRSALSSQFPTVEALVGKAFFVAMARDFIVAAPPTSPVIMNYGAGFADFIQDYPPAQGVPYLSDMARFEWALHQVRHAADVPPMDPQYFATLAPEDLLALELKLIPAACLFSSDYTIARIWRAHLGADGELSGIGSIDLKCSLLIVRCASNASIVDLTHGETVLLEALDDGANLGTAMADALEEDRSLDVPYSIRKLAGAACLRIRRDKAVSG